MAIHSDRKSNQVWQGAFILTIAGIITKLLSAIYRIPYQNLAGDIGFYIYQQIYPFYGIALVLSTYGFPVIVSKMLAERWEEHDDEGVNKILMISFLFFLLIGLLSFTGLYFGARQIAKFMGDIQLVPLLKVISFTFLLLPIVSLLRGYFQGQNNMKPTAISQVAEQSVRVVTIIAATYLLLSNGYNVYQAGAGAVFGSMTGGFCALFVLIAFWRKFKRKKQKNALVVSSLRASSIIKILFFEGIMICISGMLLILIQLIDALSLYSLLVSNGIGDTAAKIAKGIYDRGQPLIQLGTVVATSLSLSLVPLISSAKVRRDFSFIEEKVSLALRVSVVVGLGASVGLCFVMKPTNRMLFEDSKGSTILMILAFSILFTSLILTACSILQGLGYTIGPAIVVLFGLVIKWGLNELFIPILHTMGAAISSLLSYLMITVILYLYLRTKQKVRIKLNSLLWKVSFAAIIMIVVLLLFLFGTNTLFVNSQNNRMFATFQSLVGVILGGSVYIIAILKGNIFTKKELTYIPLGHKLMIFLGKNQPNK